MLIFSGVLLRLLFSEVGLLGIVRKCMLLLRLCVLV